MPQDTMKSILITGAATGLGRAASLYLAERGFTVYATVLQTQEGEALAAAARERQVHLRVLRLDITDQHSIDAAVQTVMQESGSLYGLVNNAGTRLRGCFEDLADSEIRRLFNTNVFGTMAMTRAVLPAMRAARTGRIVLIASIAGKIGSFGVSAYCATKFAQEGFGESLAQEVLPFGIRVSIVEPAIIKTEAWNINRVTAAGSDNPHSPYYAWFQRSEQLSDRMVATSPTRPEEVARAVYQALTERRPRLHYLVGSRARLVFALRRYLPGELFERIYFSLLIKKVTRHA